MLTPTNRKNIKNFENLNPNHQRVFKSRLKTKCILSLKDIEIVLINYEKLGIRIDKFIDINQLISLMELYEKLSLLQNM